MVCTSFKMPLILASVLELNETDAAYSWGQVLLHLELHMHPDRSRTHSNVSGSVSERALLVTLYFQNGACAYINVWAAVIHCIETSHNDPFSISFPLAIEQGRRLGFLNFNVQGVVCGGCVTFHHTPRAKSPRRVLRVIFCVSTHYCCIWCIRWSHASRL